MAINNFYVKLNNNGELERTGKIYTHGIGANGIGGEYINCENIIRTMRELLERCKDNEKEQNEVLTKWNETGDNKFGEEFKKLEQIELNLYNSYYGNVFSLLTVEEVENLQKKIGYNFMSESFINQVIDYLENVKLKEVA